MLFALSTTNEIGLASVGGAFIVFALVSSFVLPALNPNFPGRGLPVYLTLSVAFFAAMISAVLIFGKEKKVAAAAGGTPAATSTTAAAPTGNATAGKAVFASSGCAACHTFTPAGAKGTVGPNLDKLASEAAAFHQPVGAFARTQIVTPDTFRAPGFPAGVMPKTFATSLTKTQLDDLVAFVTQGTAAAGGTPAATSTAGAGATGNQTAGKAVFASSGCAACHTFAPAGATGAVGPSLDKLAAAAAAVHQPLDAFVRTQIVTPDTYRAAGFPAGVMPRTFAASLSKTQLDDLVAFVTQGK
jgi:cytochrome c2